MDILIGGKNGRGAETFVNMNHVAIAMFDSTPGFEKLMVVTPAGATVNFDDSVAASLGQQLRDRAEPIPEYAPKSLVLS